MTLEERHGSALCKYGCYLCETTYKGYKAAFEIEATGTPRQTVLTLTAYSDEEAIITGIFSEIEQIVREQVAILDDWKESELYMCTQCGDPNGYDPKTADENGIVRCKRCGVPHRLPRYIIGK